MTQDSPQSSQAGLVERLRRGPVWGDGSPIGSVVGEVNGATMREAADEIERLSALSALEGVRVEAAFKDALLTIATSFYPLGSPQSVGIVTAIEHWNAIRESVLSTPDQSNAGEFVTVPRVPTEAMKKAGASAAFRADSHGDHWIARASAAWSAMLAALSTPVHSLDDQGPTTLGQGDEGC